MNIIVDNGAYTLRNMGDVAMLQTAIARTRRSYPHARLHVLTSKPELLPRYCPGTIPLSAPSRNAAYLPPEHGPIPSAFRSFWRKVRGKKPAPPPNPDEFRKAFAQTQRIIVAGGGFLNDLNAQASLAVLSMVEEGILQGRQAAFFGQGLGPMQDPKLLRLLGNAIRNGAWIGLRERKRGVAILEATGASADRVSVTGDDALDAAYELAHAKPPQLRDGLGFSLRHVEYSGMQPLHIERVSIALNRLKSRLSAHVIPLPISFNSFEDDPAAIAKVTGEPCMTPDDPESIIRAAAASRVVLTGTYHAGVFALAQGVPCVCFYASPYYRDKLEGLKDLFGEGCALVDFTKEDGAERIVSEGERLWSEAAALERPLREAAAEQVHTARAFYKRALNSG